MKTISKNFDNLMPTDIEAIAKKTNYSIRTVQALLTGRRRMTARNKIVFELAGKIAKIREQAAQKVNNKISNL